VQLAIAIQASCASNTLRDFKIKLEEDAEAKKKLSALQSEVEQFALAFPMPGYDDVWSDETTNSLFILWNMPMCDTFERFGDCFF